MCMLGNYFGFSVFAEKYNGMNYATFLFISSYYLNEQDILTLHYLFHIKKTQGFEIFFLFLYCAVHGGIIAYYQFFCACELC